VPVSSHFVALVKDTQAGEFVSACFAIPPLISVQTNRVVPRIMPPVSAKAWFRNGIDNLRT